MACTIEVMRALPDLIFDLPTSLGLILFGHSPKLLD
jgi:hypothetical protein